MNSITYDMSIEDVSKNAINLQKDTPSHRTRIICKLNKG